MVVVATIPLVLALFCLPDMSAIRSELGVERTISELAITVRFALAMGDKAGGACGYQSMQQRQGFSLYGKAKTTGANLSLHRWRSR